jgi:hypothetical protein
MTAWPTCFDNDADGFGSTTLVTQWWQLTIECNDNQLLYALMMLCDGFGSTTLAACGVTYGADCDMN